MNTAATQVSVKRRIIPKVRRLVVKLGSGVLSAARGLRRKRVASLVRDMAAICQDGRQLVIVSSGAIAAGRGRLNLRQQPNTVRMKQAVAAVGQIYLMAHYRRIFGIHGRHVAQILLTRDDFANRTRYLNAERTLTALLDLGIVPIVNENDSVAVDEVKFGDNDLLCALTATLIGADLLVILSDVAGLHERDPRRDPAAAVIPLAKLDAETRRRAGTSTGRYGTGGMASKLAAARVATRGGIPTVIADGTREGILAAILDPRAEIGTLIPASEDRLARRKHWIAYTLRPAGSLTLDHGACQAVLNRRGSLLPPGLREVAGHFRAGDCVRCTDLSGNEIARGLVNYNDDEIRKIAGARTREIERRLGYRVSDEVIHRDNLVVTAAKHR